MVSRKTKCRKLRGHVSHGHGRVGKHRKHPGGRGKCGAFKHMKSWFTKYHPDHIGKKGVRAMHYQKSRYYWKEMNTNWLWNLIPQEDFIKYTTGDIAPVVDVTQYGYSKVVGETILERPIVVKARSFSQEAEEAIVKQGGQCILVA